MPATIAISSSDPKPRPSLGRIAWTLAAGVLLLSLGAYAALHQTAAQREAIRAIELARQRAEAEAFVRKEIDPLFTAAAEADRAATVRAVASLHERFKAFHDGVPAFVDDVTSWGTRFGVIGRSSNDTWARWWRGDAGANSVQQYIEAKFKAEVVSEEALRAAVTDVLQQFHEDLSANRNELFTQIHTRLRSSDAPIQLRAIDFTEFERRLSRHASSMLSDMGQSSVTSGVTAFAGSAVGEEVARRLAMQIIGRVAASLATEASVTLAASGGATGGAAATGAATGTAAGPAGTVIGVGVGLAIGVAIDWWMTARFQEKLTVQCHAFLDNVEKNVLEGSGDAAGLEKVLTESIELSRATQREAVIASVTNSER